MRRVNERFAGLERIYGPDSAARLAKARVLVVGLGGVGSWAVEALARSGVGHLTLIDGDDICVSNVNRQLHALDGAIGRRKAGALAERVRAINPDIDVTVRDEFVYLETMPEYLAPGYDFVIDAIDGVTVKAGLISACRDKGIPVVTCGAAGGKTDPTRIRVADIADSHYDRLLMYVRKKLRHRFGFPRPGGPMGVLCIFSNEQVIWPDEPACAADQPAEDDPFGASDAKLNCEGRLGSSAFVTGTFGLVAASVVVNAIARPRR